MKPRDLCVTLQQEWNAATQSSDKTHPQLKSYLWNAWNAPTALKTSQENSLGQQKASLACVHRHAAGHTSTPE